MITAWWWIVITDGSYYGSGKGSCRDHEPELSLPPKNRTTLLQSSAIFAGLGPTGRSWKPSTLGIFTPVLQGLPSWCRGCVG